MGFELAAAEEIEKELVALELIFGRIGGMIEEVLDHATCPGCNTQVRLPLPDGWVWDSLARSDAWCPKCKF